MSNVSRLDPKSPSRSPVRSPVPSLYAGQTGEVASRTWQTEIKSAFIPFDLEEFQDGGIGTKIIACLMSPLFILSKFTAPVLDEENLDVSWNKVNDSHFRLLNISFSRTDFDTQSLINDVR